MCHNMILAVMRIGLWSERGTRKRMKGCKYVVRNVMLMIVIAGAQVSQAHPCSQ